MAVPVNVLLDEDDAFLPPLIRDFVLQVQRETGPHIYYKEYEAIYQEVGQVSWIALEARLGALQDERWQQWQRHINTFSWSLNFWSTEVREGWKEAYRLTNEPFRIHRLIESSGYLLCCRRTHFLNEHNRRHPELAPPLAKTDNLLERLKLASWEPRFYRRRRWATDSLEMHRAQINDELAQLERKGVRVRDVLTKNEQRVPARSTTSKIRLD